MAVRAVPTMTMSEALVVLAVMAVPSRKIRSPAAPKVKSPCGRARFVFASHHKAFGMVERIAQIQPFDADSLKFDKSPAQRLTKTMNHGSLFL